MLLTFFSAGLPAAYTYFLPKLTMNQGKDVINKLTYLFFATGILFSIFLYTTSGFIADILKNPGLERGLKLFAPVPLLMMPAAGVEGIYTSLRKTHVIAVYTVITRLIMLAFITFPVIILKGTYETAILGWLASSFLTFFMAIYLKYKPYKGISKTTSAITYKKILDYSFPLMIASLTGVVIQSADQFFISRYFGTEAFADYSNGFVQLPFVTMITGSIHAVFVPLFARLIEKEDGNILIAQTWQSGVTKAIILLYPVLIFFMFFAKEVIYILFGPLYDKSFLYFRLALILNFFMPFLFYSILLATGKTRTYALMHIVYAIVLWFLGYMVCRISNSPIHYIVLTVFLGFLFRPIGLYFAAKSIKVRLLDLINFKKTLIILLIAFSIGLISLLASRLVTDNLIVSLVAGGLFYSISLFAVDRLFKIGILDTAISVIRKQ
jgi:O-antigen/teichoic acid export membrane protein